MITANYFVLLPNTFAGAANDDEGFRDTVLTPDGAR
jgi:hypothetical protein